MTQIPQNPSNPHQETSQNEADIRELIARLRRKEGNWVEWGDACNTLQKSGYNSQTIFEETGFEPVHQNQVIVGAAVYQSMINAGLGEAASSHFGRKGSDILYELRVLTKPERVAAADFIVECQLDADDAKELAKAMKDWSRMRQAPEGFSQHPGDIVAYQCWKVARQQKDLQERSRSIAKGLRLARTQTARQQLEKLLTDFTVVPKRPAPILPIYRLESQEELPRILPVVGQMPLTASELKAVPLVEEMGPFKMVKFSGMGAWVAIPGWQAVMNAEDPVAMIEQSDRLPVPLPGQPEDVIIVADKAERQWKADCYFLVDREEQLEIQCFDEAPDVPILGRVIVVVRPKKIFDEEIVKDQWQIED
jgi:hypothetical protein